MSGTCNFFFSKRGWLLWNSFLSATRTLKHCCYLIFYFDFYLNCREMGIFRFSCNVFKGLERQRQDTGIAYFWGIVCYDIHIYHIHITTSYTDLYICISTRIRCTYEFLDTPTSLIPIAASRGDPGQNRSSLSLVCLIARGD